MHKAPRGQGPLWKDRQKKHCERGTAGKAENSPIVLKINNGRLSGVEFVGQPKRGGRQLVGKRSIFDAPVLCDTFQGSRPLESAQLRETQRHRGGDGDVGQRAWEVTCSVLSHV